MRSARAVLAMQAVILPLGLLQCSAHVGASISEDDLASPWADLKRLVLQLPDLFRGLVESEKRAHLDRRLEDLDAQLATLRRQKDEVVLGLCTDPQFAYKAALSSYEMSQQVDQIIKSFDSMCSDLKIRERDDVEDTKKALNRLRQLLFEKRRLEREVAEAKTIQQREALAARWGAAAAAVEDVRDSIVEVRKDLKSGAQRAQSTGGKKHRPSGLLGCDAQPPQ